MEPMVVVRNLVKHFPIRGGVFSRVTGHVKAVDGVSFDIHAGETYALVGESGCGKSTTGQTVLKLLNPSSGSVHFDGKDVFSLSPGALRSIRKQMQIVFQDPYSALNPRMSIGKAIGETIRVHGLAQGTEVRDRVEYYLKTCGLAEYHYKRYTHEFSGGQRPRIVIARALALDPKFIVADEPVSALDVSIQSQIINLLERLQGEFNLTYLFISHDLGVVKHMADRIGVMYLGKLVEEAPKREFYARPLHPYSQALLSAIPVADPTRKRQRIVLEGDVPSPADPPPGCPFHTRCPLAVDICRSVVPELKAAAAGHKAACHVVHGDA